MARILVAEDDPRIVSLVRQRLTIEGFQVLEAGDPQEAWRTLIEDGPDAALIDLSLRNEADGWRLIGTVRDDRRFIPVTGVTVSMPDGSNPSTVPFLQVKKADILAVYPADA